MYWIFFKCFLSIKWDDHVVFFFLWVCSYSRLLWRMPIYWTIPALINDHFAVFWDSVCKYFIEYFCFNVSHLACVTEKTPKFMFFSIFKNLKLKVATVVPNPKLWEMHQENRIFKGRVESRENLIWRSTQPLLEPESKCQDYEMPHLSELVS